MLVARCLEVKVLQVRVWPTVIAIEQLRTT